jgi:CubicO group peptidase (beta-lactamase class C family)
MRWTAATADSKIICNTTKLTPDGQYGYQWWHLGAPPGSGDRVMATADQSIWALGIYGQALAIDPRRKLVMVQWSTYKEADGPDSLFDEQMLFFHAIDESLDGSGV